MRKASKATIKKVLAEFATHRAAWEKRLAALTPAHVVYVRQWIADLQERITDGECTHGHACTRALAASIERDIVAWETGYYKGLSDGGGRLVA